MFKLIKPTFKPSFKPLKVNALMNNFIKSYQIQTRFKPASNKMSTSVNGILCAFGFNWGFEGMFEGGLKLSLKGIQPNSNQLYCRCDDLNSFGANGFEDWFEKFERTHRVIYETFGHSCKESLTFVHIFENLRTLLNKKNAVKKRPIGGLKTDNCVRFSC